MYEYVENDWKDAKNTADIKRPTNNPNYNSNIFNKTNFIQFYWLDVFEESNYKDKGTVYLFGKALVNKNDYVSCCVRVEVPRVVYVVPREFVSSFISKLVRNK